MIAPYPSEATLGWVRDAMGGAIMSVRSMGVASTTMHAVSARDRDGVVRRLALRRYHDMDRLDMDPWYVPDNEATVLGLLDDAEVPAPRLLAADAMATVCDLPALLTTRLPGRPVDRPKDLKVFLGDMAWTLARVHEVESRGGVWLPRYQPYYDPVFDGPRRPPAWSSSPALWERVFAILEGPEPDGRQGFIHRDFHPGQILWADGRLSGVVDWTTGCRGPFGIDLARVRLNLALDVGVNATLAFLDAYRAAAGTEPRHPYWDLLDVADFALAPPDPAGDPAGYARLEEWVALAVSES
jgi:aminoglycoside phosphotransferase (APT) family kinase protein